LSKNTKIASATLKVNLSDNNLGIKGVTSLARVLVNSPFLQSLDISRNRLRGKGLSDILDSLVNNQGLMELYIGRNLQVTNQSFNHI
jgi:hypothetical protein